MLQRQRCTSATLKIATNFCKNEKHTHTSAMQRLECALPKLLSFVLKVAGPLAFRSLHGCTLDLQYKFKIEASTAASSKLQYMIYVQFVYSFV